MSVKRIVLIVACVAGGVAACTEEPSRITIGMSVPNADTAFYEEMVAGARREARRRGAALMVSTAGYNDGTQARAVDRFLEEEVDAIVVDGVGPRVVASTRRAREAGIPVIGVGDVLPNQRLTTSVVSENVIAGRIAAEYLFFRMGGTGGVVEIVPFSRRPSATEVQRGFREIADRTPTITIAASRSSPNGEEGAASLAMRLFASTPDLKGVFAGTDEIALGAVRAARRLELLDGVVIVGVGGTRPALAAIETGRLEGSVLTDPEELGRRAVEAAVRAARGERVPRRHVVDVTLVTEENVKKFLP